MMPIICFLAVLLVSTAIAIIVYTSVMLGWCGFGFRLLQNPTSSSSSSSAGSPAGTTKSLINLSPYLASRFKHTKGIEKGGDNNNEEAGIIDIIEQDSCCVVCLSGFEDGDNICQLPNCNHSFHSPCIDMWLYSHSDCPVCRSPVDRVDCCRSTTALAPPEENHCREVLIDIGILSHTSLHVIAF